MRWRPFFGTSDSRPVKSCASNSVLWPLSALSFWVQLGLVVPWFASAEEAWSASTTNGVVVKTRTVNAAGLNEVWAEAEVAASVREVYELLKDIDAQRHFFAYVKESRKLDNATAGQGQYNYILLDMPIIGKRDTVVQFWFERVPDSEGKGELFAKWTSAHTVIAPRPGVVRIEVNSGSWEVKPLGPQRSRVIYRVQVDPGGRLPTFAVNFGNASGVPNTLRALEREAQRRRALKVSGH
jgi:Polyketide cyclase / dehydrase and lipid transport